MVPSCMSIFQLPRNSNISIEAAAGESHNSISSLLAGRTYWSIPCVSAFFQSCSVFMSTLVCMSASLSLDLCEGTEALSEMASCRI